MPIPSTVADLSTTASANYPSGSESPNILDEYHRALAAIVRQVSDAKASAGLVTSSGLTTSATDKIIGRSSSGGGAVEEITCTAAGRALIDDADVAAQRATLGLGTAALLDSGIGANNVLKLDANANLGLGASPSASRGVLQVAQGGISGGAPQATGSNDSNQFATLGNSNVSLRFGVYASGAVWIQPSLISNYATNFDLSLNPNGGNVVVQSGKLSSTQAAKAWVNFDGTLTGTITPRANLNIASVTKNGTGDYTLNIAGGVLADANYAPAVTSSSNGISSAIATSVVNTVSAPTTTALRIGFTFGNTGTPGDPARCNVTIFGN